MSLDEIEAFYRSVKNCPRCNSAEGFWLTAKRDRSYVQCKHCGAVLEFCEILPYGAKGETAKGSSVKLKKDV